MVSIRRFMRATLMRPVYEDAEVRPKESRSDDPLAIEDLTEDNLGARGYSMIPDPEREVGEDSGVFLIKQADGNYRVRIGRLDGDASEMPLHVSTPIRLQTEDPFHDTPVINGPSRRGYANQDEKWY
jgi:hypothetical protein